MYKIVLDDITDQRKLDNIVKVIELLRDLYPERTLVDIVAMVFHLPAEIGYFESPEEAHQWQRRLEMCGAAVRLTATVSPPLTVKPCHLS